MFDPFDDPERKVLDFLKSNYSGSLKLFEKGRSLLWQGDEVHSVFAINRGAVKIFSISYDGKVYSYGIVGEGGLIGSPEILARETAKVMVETIKETEVIVIPKKDFLALLSADSGFSLMVAKKLAKHLIYMSDKAKGLGFFDVQQRLKDTLANLAVDYGIKTEKGIQIKLDITHKDIGELIGANRTTITYFINELKRQGYLSKEGKHLVINPPNDMINHDDLDSDLFDSHKKH